MFNSKAQTNLVPNPSFEYTIDCLLNGGDIIKAIPWFAPNTVSSSDYFNACYYYPTPPPCGGGGVPNNLFGFQEARTGQAYAGIGLYESGWPHGGYREYIEVKLNDTLEAYKLYCVEFWVSLTRLCNNPEPDGIDGIGAYFSKDSVRYLNTDTSYVINVSPQVLNPIGNIISDTTNWVKISGVFTAQGGEDYLTIGNFIRDENLHISFPPHGGYAYYYIDDVSVIECDTTTIPPIETLKPPQLPNIFTPNGDGINDKFEAINTVGWQFQMQVLNRWGVKVYEGKEWDGKNMADGVYFYIFHATAKDEADVWLRGSVELLRN